MDIVSGVFEMRLFRLNASLVESDSSAVCFRDNRYGYELNMPLREWRDRGEPARFVAYIRLTDNKTAGSYLQTERDGP